LAGIGVVTDFIYININSGVHQFFYVTYILNVTSYIHPEFQVVSWGVLREHWLPENIILLSCWLFWTLKCMKWNTRIWVTKNECHACYCKAIWKL